MRWPPATIRAGRSCPTRSCCASTPGGWSWTAARVATGSARRVLLRHRHADRGRHLRRGAGSVDIALTALDLVARWRAARLRPVPAAGPSRRAQLIGGYCFFNNAAIVAEASWRAAAQRVAILDIDFHHGNGTQQIFWDRGDVLYVSLHGDPGGATRTTPASRPSAARAPARAPP